MSPIPYEGRRVEYIRAIAAARRDAINALRSQYPQEWGEFYEAAKVTRLREAGLHKVENPDPDEV